jgi:inositol-phosphate transport system permease protein
MAVPTTFDKIPTTTPAGNNVVNGLTLFNTILWSIRQALITAVVLLIFAAIFEYLLRPALASVNVQESFTATIAGLCIGLLPPAAYIASGVAARRVKPRSLLAALLSAWIVTLLAYGLLVAYQASTETGPFRQGATLNFTVQQAAEGVEVVAVEPGGAAEEAGLQPGDIITAIRRDEVNSDQLLTAIGRAEDGDALRFRLVRGGEEQQLTARVRVAAQVDTSQILRNLLVALVIASLAVIIPANWTPHLLLIGSLLPLLAGYLWLFIATFSARTHGLLPVDSSGNFGGWTMANWGFLAGERIGGPSANIWTVTLNSLFIAVSMTIVSLIICSMAGYALSRMNFPGRRAFLSMTLILHGFPAITLLIPIFLVLINVGNIPLLGRLFGYNTVGGIALVMIAFELPLGVWLIKGFFDTIPWDMERSALIDGASRWRTFWEIILPQIRPGLLALGIFSFIGGWNAYLIPATYSIGTGLANLPVYISQLSGEMAPTNWNQVAAVGLFQLIPILLFFIFAQEYLLNIYAGGSKGSS